MIHPKWIIFSSIFISWMGVAVNNPLMAPIARSMGLTEIQAGWLISITAIMSIIGSLFLGRKSDTLGRKKILLIGMTGFTITMFFFGILVQMGLSKPTLIGIEKIFLLLLLIRLIQGLFFGAIPSTGQAYMADITTGKERLSAMALIGSANGLGFVLGPMLGAFTVGFHMATPFYISAFLTAGVTIWLWISLTNKKTHIYSDENESTAKPILFSKVWLPLACSLLLTMALSILQVTSGFYIQDTLHISIKAATRYVTILITIAGISVVLTQILIVNRFRWSPITLIRIGLPIVFIGFFLISITYGIFYLIISFLLIGIGTGMALPASMSAASLMVDKTQQGKIAGMITAANAAGSIIAPLLGTYLYHFYPQSPYYTCVILLMGASLLIWTVGRKKLNISSSEVGK
ncbi:Predicted arabinose efflux permease, MFS family [Seinonella peptonophila]|uniref:Predicted arabinose efflux permease, MFS family n=1 Tax=Seinonella peptonophila TaxID=112248 RepID=A0A1M4X5R0_9BACL|nr:Predicted arabinose efflux permease, MFS family [Seinonella peptonophila]